MMDENILDTGERPKKSPGHKGNYTPVTTLSKRISGFYTIGPT